MWNVFLWCFFLPTIVTFAVLILIKIRILPLSVRVHLDWLMLISPTGYSLYILGSEVLAQLPYALKKGGSAASLLKSLEDGAWRERVCDSMNKSVAASNAKDWEWIATSFQMDLQAMHDRTKYLTALAGAVFFLLMQGIDSLADTEEAVRWVKVAPFGWVETSASNNLFQFVGLALFLTLLYLSGIQTYQSLRRYLNCAVLIRQKNG